jgi:hypothetical protein
VVFAGTADDDVFLVFLGRVPVEGAVVFEEGDLLGGGEVLVAEEDDAALRDEEGEFVELGWGECRELDVGEDGTEGFGELWRLVSFRTWKKDWLDLRRFWW